MDMILIGPSYEDRIMSWKSSLTVDTSVHHCKYCDVNLLSHIRIHRRSVVFGFFQRYCTLEQLNGSGNPSSQTAKLSNSLFDMANSGGTFRMTVSNGWMLSPNYYIQGEREFCSIKIAIKRDVFA